ncbi:MAG: hypothetical protein JXB03_12125 [Spirochaetales bacterium]|nr:hypothetical protein [Spirochaetales bacterium]
MDTSLSVLSRNAGIQSCTFLPAEVTGSDLEQAMPIAAGLYRSYGCVLYGGQTASPHIYGYKTMRSPTTDLDFLCTIESARMIVQQERGLLYHPDYDILFCYRSHIPLTFAVAHIHDCLAGSEVIATAETVQTPYGPIACANREFCIILKMRRSEDCLARRRSIFGKDALDIISIVTRAAADERPLDVKVFAALFRTHVTADREEALEICTEINLYENHLAAHERGLFLAEWERLVRGVAGACA